MRVLLAILALPLLEIAGFVVVGGWIGLWATLALVILSAVAGVWVARLQGARVAGDLAAASQGLRDPGKPLAEGAIVLVAAMLLIVPGFLTDLAGIALLVPAVRRALFRRIVLQRASMQRTHTRNPGQTEVIDAEYIDVTPPKRSRWTDQQP